MSADKDSVSQAIQSCERAISAAEGELSAAYDSLHRLRELLKADAHEEGAPDPVAERMRLETWNRMSATKGAEG